MYEELIMYVTDYILSIEFYDGEFTREKTELTFKHRDNWVDRMINSLKVDENNLYFEFEYDRIEKITNKLVIGLLYLKFGIKKEIIKSNFVVVTQLTSSQMIRITKYRLECSTKA